MLADHDSARRPGPYYRLTIVVPCDSSPTGVVELRFATLCQTHRRADELMRADVAARDPFQRAR